MYFSLHKMRDKTNISFPGVFSSTVMCKNESEYFDQD